VTVTLRLVFLQKHFYSTDVRQEPFLRQIVLACFFAPILLAQPTNLKFSHITLEQGLSQSTVNAIVQDAQGFMWFGTQDGLNRYDGYAVTVFKHSAADTNSLPDNSIWCLLNDSRGDLWIGTLRGGASRYIPSENRFVHYRSSPTNPASISEDNVTSLFEDSRGNVWLGTLNGGVNRHDRATNRFTRFVHDEAIQTSLANNTVWSMAEDRSGNLYVATWRGLSRLNLNDEKKGFVSFHHNPSDSRSLAGENIRVVYVDRSGTLWIGTWGNGLDQFYATGASPPATMSHRWRAGASGGDERTQAFRHFAHDTRNTRSISGNQILSIYEDAKGNLWIGTNDAGLNLFNPSDETFTRYRNDPQTATSLNNDQVSAMCEDRAGALWIGTGAGGVNVFDWRKSRFALYRDLLDHPSDLNGNDVWAILEDRNDELWVGTYGTGLSRFERNRRLVANYRFDAKNARSLSHDNVLSLCEGADGTIWIGTEGGGLNRFERRTNSFTRWKHEPNNSNSISLNEITALHEDRNRQLWIGTNGGRVDRLDIASGTFHHYVPDEKKPSALSGTSVMEIFEGSSGTIWIGTLGGGLLSYDREADAFKRYSQSPGVSANTVLSLGEDNDGMLWVGTYGGGLHRFDRATGEISLFTEENGLPNNVVYGILPDNHGNLWMSTNKGISRFNPERKTFRNYDATDGLQGNEFNQGAFFRSRRGELFFGGINGLNSFFPDSIKDNDFVPPIFLTSFKVFDKPMRLAGTQHITLAHDENFFSFEFVALNFTSPEKNQYAYTLDGLDKNWISASAARRYASYTNLDPGEYTLRVKGSNNDGLWNESGAMLGITITPPYWKTWWFRIAAAVAIGGILFAMYRYRVNKLLEIERIRSSIATDLHDDIGSTLTEIALYSDVSLRELRAKKLEQKPDGDFRKVESHLEEIGTTSRGLIDAMNDIVWAVDPKNDSFEFLLLRMKTHAARMFDAKGINYEIEIPEELSHLHLPLGFRRRFYLIFKEAINNIVRHAHPTKVLLKIRKEGRVLVMTIVDDGVGFDVENANEGNGMTNMRKRSESLSGSLSIKSALNQGTTVRLRAAIP
jgi:ligand-binding sensor domain-containing protein